jgi:hypothetical protein
MSIDEIISDLLNDYNIDKLTCEEETKDFLEQLLEKNIIKEVS